MAYIDHEHSSSVRLFKWPAKLFIEKPDDDDKECRRSEAELMILIRSASPELVAIPFSSIDHFCVFFETRIMPCFPKDSSLLRVAYDLTIRELFLKFGFTDKLDDMIPDHALVMFFDLKINREKLEDGHLKILKEMYPSVLEKLSRFSKIKVDSGMNLERVEEIEACLKGFPGMVVEGAAGGMEEARYYAETGVLLGDEEDDQDCAICLQSICFGEKYVKTCCSKHRFHRSCFSVWMFDYQKDICPMCRNIFEISI